MRTTTISVLTIALSTGSVLAQDVSAGETSFRNKCQICHDVGENARTKLGPPLNLDGRKAGTVDGFSYSEGLKNSGITWSEEAFKEYIKDPRAKIPDTKMFFVGIKDETEIGNLWAYLKSSAATAR